MRPLHRKLLEGARAQLPDAEARPETPERIAAAERRLGGALPPGYRAFLEELGSTFWPLTIGNVVDFEIEGADLPSFFVPFADDGGGNLHGFDTRGRRGRELPIAYYDHEEPELDEDPGTPDRFESWLGTMVEDALREERDARTAEQRARIVRALEGHVLESCTPTREQIAEAEEALGVTLPEDYVWFTTQLGATSWPVRIVDAVELGDLTRALRARWPRAPARLAAFAHEGDAVYVAFDRRGALRGFGSSTPVPSSFLDYLEQRIARAPAMPSAAASRELRGDADEEVARRLLQRLREEKLLETTRGFAPEPVARAIADAERDPVRISDILLDRADVVELYASVEDIAKLLAELGARGGGGGGEGGVAGR